MNVHFQIMLENQKSKAPSTRSKWHQTDHQIENKISTNWKKRKRPKDQITDKLSTKCHQTETSILRPNDQSDPIKLVYL